MVAELVVRLKGRINIFIGYLSNSIGDFTVNSKDSIHSLGFDWLKNYIQEAIGADQ